VNEHEARAMRDLVEAAVERVFERKFAPACADLKAIRAEIESLSGLPKTVTDLTNQALALDADVKELTRSVGMHTAKLQAAERALRDFEPKLNELRGISAKLGELGILVPKAIARIETAFKEIDANKEAAEAADAKLQAADAELRDSLADLEEAAGERRSASP
jgi:DNA repair ATPase RecN